MGLVSVNPFEPAPAPSDAGSHILGLYIRVSQRPDSRNEPLSERRTGFCALVAAGVRAAFHIATSGCIRRMANPGRVDLERVEAQTGSCPGADDLVRLQHVYNRG